MFGDSGIPEDSTFIILAFRPVFRILLPRSFYPARKEIHTAIKTLLESKMIILFKPTVSTVCPANIISRIFGVELLQNTTSI